MFVKAIEEVGQFTRPVHTITRNYNETEVSAGAATLFFVNEMGVAVTCKHVADLISNHAKINAHYENFVKERDAIGKNNRHNKRLKDLELKYNFKEDSLIQLNTLFFNCSSERNVTYRCINHPQHDLSILIFENFKNPLYNSHAVFRKDTSGLKQGKYMCRLGYLFPEFTNFKYNETNDTIEWTTTRQAETPRFPIEGMLTRHLVENGKIAGIELSTPGLRGQSGGPLFDEQGLICGMQSSTHHLHLGFDMKKFEHKVGGKTIQITNQPFLHVGRCVHADIIKEFLSANNIKFYEG